MCGNSEAGKICPNLTVADPGSGQGGLKIFPEILPTKQSGVRQTKQANISLGPGPALGSWKLLHF